jgi:nitrite reductase/ring-hydroxylating ferredoxin subunit
MNNNNVIKLSELEQDIKKVFSVGYGEIISLVINGEYYTIENDLK